ncbi:5'-methylthioadenosine/S-adenosylhomocysteine nucleosidase [Arcanobacterium hippocoleae]|uniref:adenosylhomocysteine nucleosidase n=1 Tax=Arcanobacterium hippocoleae TaxID=149017 RepID=A0ABU1T2E9_9ACTO|nr:5'-methylthioadenosine/S-adenosylhomocysteine nucleosidase [Arcanobacterium hippocoleae]MDR6939524.1 5'-methylthioadenosine/S-adenosylhomocysteine nucleosidase [Arcanobacterium hippocoleae]
MHNHQDQILEPPSKLTPRTISRIPITALFISAMPAESTELRNALIARLKKINQSKIIDHTQIKTEFGATELITCPIRLSVEENAQTKPNFSYLLATSGIGMVNAAATLSSLLTQYAPEIIVCTGSAGGLHPNSRVRDVVIGTEYLNSRADATAFGYAPGQVPGNPASISITDDVRTAIAAALTKTASSEAGAAGLKITAYSGQMLSSDAFVTDANVETTRELFPDGLTADMESQAFAQVAAKYANTPFVAVRGISDLCSTPEDQSISFHAELSEVAAQAAQIALDIVENFAPKSL